MLPSETYTDPSQTNTDTEPLSKTDTGVTILFSGLIFFQRDHGLVFFEGDKQKKQCRAYPVPFGDHQLVVDIQKIEFDESGIPRQATKIPLTILDPVTKIPQIKLDPTKDVYINGLKQGATNGAKQWVKLFLPNGEKFSKTNSKVDERDFRWILNLYGDEFGRQSEVKPSLDEIKQSVHITNGIMYAEKLTDETFASQLQPTALYASQSSPTATVTRPSRSNGDLKLIGKVAYRVGVDIRLREGGAVCLGNTLTDADCESNGKGIKLEFQKNTRYVVTIENFCAQSLLASRKDTPPPRETRSDFPEYFNFVFKSEKRFDVIRVVNKAGVLGESPFPEHPELVLDSVEISCLPAGGQNPPPGGGDPPPQGGG